MNGRPVADPVLRTAVRVAYRDVIPAGRHPVVALFLDLPTDELDVNVHPAKAEVRFRDPDAVRSLVIGSLGRALGSGAGRAAAAPRPAAGASVLPRSGPRPRFAEAALPFAAAPAAAPGRRRRRAAARRRRTTRSARRWRRCSTPTSSRSPPTAAWCWSISTRRMSG